MALLSLTGEIKKYYRELLSDGLEHKAKELMEYAKNKSPRGDDFTSGMMSGALNTLIKNENNVYEQPSRGVYRLKSESAVVLEEHGVEENKSLTYITELKTIIMETQARVKRASGLNIFELTDEEIRGIRLAGTIVNESLDKILNQLNNFN